MLKRRRKKSNAAEEKLQKPEWVWLVAYQTSSWNSCLFHNLANKALKHLKCNSLVDFILVQLHIVTNMSLYPHLLWLFREKT
jgi:hypothetical protein